MLLIFLSCSWMLVVPLSFGSWLLSQIRRLSQPYIAFNGTVSLLMVWWMGLALLTAFLETWALFGPLRAPAFLAVAGLAVALPLLERAGWQLVWRNVCGQVAQWRFFAWVVGAAVGLVFLVLATLPPTNGDSGIYHAPFVRWYEETGAVPGLANLDVHLGYNSSWFVTEVLSSWGQWLGSPLQSLITLALMLFSGYALAPLSQRQGGPVPSQVLFRLLLGVVLLFWYGDGGLSLSADPAATVLAFTVLSQAVELGMPGRNRPLTLGHLVVVVLVCYGITIKFSVVPLLLIPIVWLWQYPASGRVKAGLLVRLTSLSLALTLPWVLNTVVLTGYLFFPFPGLDVLSVDWKFPRALLYEHVDYIRNFARNPNLHQYNVYEKPISYWLPIWWQQQQVYDRFITLAAPIIALLSVGVLALNRAWRGPHIADWILIVVTTLVGTSFWFISAPAYRFGHPFILPLFCLLLLPLLWVFSQASRLNLKPPLALSMVAALLAAALLVEFRVFGIPRRLNSSEWADLLAHVPADASRALLADAYRPDTAGYYALRLYLPSSSKMKLAAILIQHGQLRKGGLMVTGKRLVWPAPYPFNTFEKFKVGEIVFMKPAANADPSEYGSWYAPFPAASNSVIYLRTGKLRGGFRSSPLPILTESKANQP